MYSIVTQVYRFGIKRDEREIANDPGRPGVLSLVYFDTHPVLQFARADVNRSDNKIYPGLFEPRCIGWNQDLMVWRGYQKPRMKREHEEAPACLQEWRVRLIDRSELDRIGRDTT